MPPSAASSRADANQPPLTLASRAFPRRVRRLLEGVLEYASDELERGLTATLDELEQQLFRMAEQARSNDVQQGHFEALRAVKRSRADFTPRYMIGLESSLAGLREPPVSADAQPPDEAVELSLLEDHELEENAVLEAIASRAEVRASLPLYLLGQRFGVLAGRPAFEPEALPVGPQALCRILRRAADCLEVQPAVRLLVFRQFERNVIGVYSQFVDSINTFLAGEGVLPTLSYVPMRARRPASGAPPKAPGEASPSRSPSSHGPPPPASPPPDATGGTRAVFGLHAPQPQTGWPGERGFTRATHEPDADDGRSEEMFSLLRQLLADRRELADRLAGGDPQPSTPTHVASQSEVESALGALQLRVPTLAAANDADAGTAVADVKEDLLERLRTRAPPGTSPVLDNEDADAIDLVSMLFEYIMRDIRPNSPAAALITKLQVPLMRVALRDKEFFTRHQHPARQMLNAIAESGVFWSEENVADRVTNEKMRHVVDRVLNDFDGNTEIFDTLAEDLGGHMQMMARKADVAERRHVEAARGKEKLALARQRAVEAIAARLEGHSIPRFTNTLLTQAWTDVLALSLLRQGDDSPTYQRQLAIAERLIAAAESPADGTGQLEPDEAAELCEEIDQALVQVGYHAEDATAIASRLTHRETAEPGEADPASRTELALRLKAKARLGGDAAKRSKSEPDAPLNPKEQGCMDRLLSLPFGAWMDFTLNQQGEVARRRLAWYSTVSGHTLFVNQRGQRVAEPTLDWLARSMARDQVRIVEAPGNGTVIDRAWGAILGTLKGLGGGASDGGKA